MSNATTIVRSTGDRRRRIKHACEACKLRKRKCDGQHPCASCTRYEYDCYYATTRKKQTAPSKESHSDSVTVYESPDLEEHVEDTDVRTEANSGTYFPKVLSLELNPTSSTKVQGFGWNLGLHYKVTNSERSVVTIISKADWDILFQTYQQKIHTVYGFLDIARVLLESSRRWSNSVGTNEYDHVLAGVAALGSLFSANQGDYRGHLLADCAKELLDCGCLIKEPSFEDAQAWVLRTIYLRCSSFPHAAWMASCTTMHIIEAVGFHREVFHSTVDDQCRRTTFWIADLLSTWISSEYGRSRVRPKGATCQAPSLTVENATGGLLKLFKVSAVIDPDRDSNPADLEIALTQVQQFTFDHIPLLLSQTNLCFAIYRRLRAKSPNLKHGITQKVLAAGCRGLQASLEALQSSSPWWHVPNIPFQFTCILLAMNTSESLSHVAQAVSTLRSVVDHFDTTITRKALSTVEQFVQLSRARKERDIAILQSSIPAQQESGIGVATGETALPLDNDWFDPMWSNDVLWNTPSLDGVDWNQLWAESFEFGT